jgi:hypothetical protein
MKYLVELLYKKCWDTEVRYYIRKYLLNDDAVYDMEIEKLAKILDELAAVCLGESDDLPLPP